MEPVAIAHVCDDYRMESNGKPFIIGLYTHTMLFSHLPAALAQLVILLTVISDIKDPITTFTVKVTAPGFDESFDYDFGNPPPSPFDDAVRAEASVVVPLRPFTVSEPGLLNIEVRYSGGVLRARRLLIDVVTAPAPSADGSTF